MPSTLLTKLLLLTILVETVIDITIEVSRCELHACAMGSDNIHQSNILYRFNQEVRSSDSTELELENKRRLPIYLIIFGLAQ